MKKFALAACLASLLSIAPTAARAEQAVQKMTPAEAEKFRAEKAAAHAAQRAADKDPREWRTIKLQYGRPSWVAWWIDPANQAEPTEFADSRKLLASVNYKPLPEEPAPRDPAKPTDARDLPVGVDEVKADDGQHTLSALASGKGLENLQKLVKVFDQPARMVGISAEMLEIEEGSELALGAGFASFTRPAEAERNNLAFLNNNFRTELDKIIAAGSARVVASYQLTAKNNMAAGDTAILEGVGAGGKKSALLTLVVTPSINNDSTVTVTVNLRGFENPFTAPAAPTQIFTLQTIANIRDKDSIVLSDLGSGQWNIPAVTSPANLAVVRAKRLYLVLRPQILEGKRFQ